MGLRKITKKVGNKCKKAAKKVGKKLEKGAVKTVVGAATYTGVTTVTGNLTLGVIAASAVAQKCK